MKPKQVNPFYRTRAWKLIRAEALARDHHLCQRCLDRGILARAEAVHHIKPIDTHPDLALEITNLRSLCKQCHNTSHGFRGGVSKKPGRKCRARVIKG